MSHKNYPGQEEPFGERQMPDVPAPYSPRFQADVADLKKLQETHREGTTPIDSLVVSTFDARPINGTDFLATNVIDDIDPGTGTFSVTYVVPPGLVAVVRDFSYEVALLTGNGLGSITVYGLLVTPQVETSNQLVRVSILINGSTLPGFNRVRLGLSVENCPAYCVANSGDSVELRVDAPNVAGTNLVGFIGQLRGTLLVASGRPTNHEPGTDQSLPVYLRKPAGRESLISELPTPTEQTKLQAPAPVPAEYLMRLRRSLSKKQPRPLAQRRGK